MHNITYPSPYKKKGSAKHKGDQKIEEKNSTQTLEEKVLFSAESS
jgi:hypothetical protein